jgi:hypothetical protein
MALALFVACALAPSSSRAAAVRVPGTRVTLDPPPGFTPSDRFPGFQRADKAASIIVTELPGPAVEMQRGMTRDVLSTRGMTLIQSQTVTVGGQDALLIHVSQSAAGTEFLKWMLVAGDGKQTVMVVGTFPKAATGLSLPIKKAVLSISWGGVVKAPPFEGLRFRVDPTPTLKLAGRVGNALVLSESGTMGPSDSDQAILVIGSSLSEASIGNVEKFARERASSSTQVGPLRNVVGHGITTDGLPGYELVAEANDVKTGRAVRMYQLVLVEGGTYYLAQGFVAASRPPEIMDQYRQVTRSFRRFRARTGGPASH